MSSFIDDKASICIPFILEHLRNHKGPQPFVIGLNGIQGAGKTALVRTLSSKLEEESVHALVCSIDDFYLNHNDLLSLGRAHPQNALLQHRGEPGMSALSLPHLELPILKRTVCLHKKL